MSYRSKEWLKLVVMAIVSLAFMLVALACSSIADSAEEEAGSRIQSGITTEPEAQRFEEAWKDGDKSQALSEVGKSAATVGIADSIEHKDPVLAKKIRTGGWDYVLEHKWEILSTGLGLGALGLWALRLFAGVVVLRRLVRAIAGWCAARPVQAWDLLETIKETVGDKKALLSKIAAAEGAKVDRTADDGLNRVIKVGDSDWIQADAAALSGLSKLRALAASPNEEAKAKLAAVVTALEVLEESGPSPTIHDYRACIAAIKYGLTETPSI